MEVVAYEQGCGAIDDALGSVDRGTVGVVHVVAVLVEDAVDIEGLFVIQCPTKTCGARDSLMIAINKRLKFIRAQAFRSIQVPFRLLPVLSEQP